MRILRVACEAHHAEAPNAFGYPVTVVVHGYRLHIEAYGENPALIPKAGQELGEYLMEIYLENASTEQIRQLHAKLVAKRMNL